MAQRKRAATATAPTRLAYQVTEAAAMLGLSRWTVRRLINAGEIRAVRAPDGNRWLIPTAELHGYLARHISRGGDQAKTAS